MKRTNKKSDAKTKATAIKENKSTETALNPVEKAIKEFLDQEALHDAAFAKKYNDGKKTIHDAFQYLYELHRPSNHSIRCAVTDNADDNLIAKKFFMDDSLKAPKEKTSAPKTSAPLPPPPPADDADLDLDNLDADLAALDELVEDEKPKAKPTTKKPSATKPAIVKPDARTATAKPTAKKVDLSLDLFDELDF